MLPELDRGDESGSIRGTGRPGPRPRSVGSTNQPVLVSRLGAMPATSRVLRAWLPVVVVAVVASLLFQLLGLPSPVLFGSLTGGCCTP